MAGRRFWLGEERDGTGDPWLLKSRFRILDEILDADSFWSFTDMPAARSAPAEVATQGSQAAAATTMLVPTMFGWFVLAPLEAEQVQPFVTSLLNPQAGGSYAIFYQPDGGLGAGASLLIDVDKREIVSGLQTGRPDITSGNDDQLVIGGGMAIGSRLGGVAAGHEQIVFLPGFDYSLTASDADVAAGENLVIIAASLGAGNGLEFDGSAERDGSYSFLGGDGRDSFTGGSGSDTFHGAGGADRLAGGGGVDVFHYARASDSSSTGYDTLVGFNYGEDVIDLPGKVTGFDPAVTHGSLSAASLDADLAAAFGPAGLGAGRAAWFTPKSGDLAGQTFLIVDANGRAGYQAGEDFVFHMAEPPPADLGGVGFFV